MTRYVKLIAVSRSGSGAGAVIIWRKKEKEVMECEKERNEFLFGARDNFRGNA